MTTTATKTLNAITVQPAPDEAGHVTVVRLHAGIEVFVLEGQLCFRDPLREVRIGPLSHEQWTLLAEDAEYEACATDPELRQDRRSMRKERAAFHGGEE